MEVVQPLCKRGRQVEKKRRGNRLEWFHFTNRISLLEKKVKAMKKENRLDGGFQVTVRLGY